MFGLPFRRDCAPERRVALSCSLREAIKSCLSRGRAIFGKWL